jgi:hypothetical protein
MPSFVNMASLTKLTSLTGNEEFQVSATNKISSRDIASLALTQQLHGFSEVTIGSPKISSTSLLLPAIAALYRLSSDNGKMLPISNGIDKFGNVVFSGTNAVGILFDVKASKYFTRSGVTATAFFNSAQWISWLQDGEAHEMESGSGVADPIQIHDFAEVSAIDNWPTPKDGLIIPFTTDSGVLNKPGHESEYVGIIICEVDTQQTGRAEVIAYGSGTGSCYIGLLDWASISIEWMVNKLSVSSKKLSAFTGTAIGNYVQSMRDSGDLFPFTTVNANKTTANQFPANGAWSGFVTIGDGGGVNIIAFKSTTDPNAEVYVGRCSGDTTQWTAVGGGGGLSFLHGEDIVEGLEYMIPENVGDVVAFRISGDSSQVPNTTEGFGLLGKINGSESLLMAVQINPNNTYEELFYTGRVQNDGSGTDWHPIGMSTATGANFPQKLLSNFTAVFDKIGEGDTLMVLMNIVGTGTAMSNGGNMIGYLQVGNSMLNKEQTLYYGRDIYDQSIVRVLAELNSFDTDGAEFTFYTDDPGGILDATLIKVYRLPK